MAKSTKSGLGRGLNSLLNDTYDEISPAPTNIKPSPQRVVVELGDDEKVELNQENREKSNSLSQNIDNQEESNTTISEKVIIKSVTQRNTDEISIDSVTPNPDQPRTNFKKEEIEELAASIEKNGLLQPILVRSIGADNCWRASLASL